MESRNDVRDIVGAVTTLAHQLGLEVIAEGVETEGQLALVRSMECEYVQGFVFSKPVDRERAAELLRSGLLPSPGSGRAAAPAPDEPSKEDGPAYETAGRWPRMSSALYVSAAVVATLALAGLVARFTAQPPSPAPASSRAALEQTVPVPQPPRAAPVSTPTVPAAANARERRTRARPRPGKRPPPHPRRRRDASPVLRDASPVLCDARHVRREDGRVLRSPLFTNTRCAAAAANCPYPPPAWRSSLTRERTG